MQALKIKKKLKNQHILLAYFAYMLTSAKRSSIFCWRQITHKSWEKKHGRVIYNFVFCNKNSFQSI